MTDAIVILKLPIKTPIGSWYTPDFISGLRLTTPAKLINMFHDVVGKIIEIV